MGKNSQYGVVLDAGSSGTRIYVYKWKNPAAEKLHASTQELANLPQIELKASDKIHPGIATFSEDVGSVGPGYLAELLSVATKKVPNQKVSETPIFLMATAGVRLLPKQRQKTLLRGVCEYLQTNTQFLLPDCDAHVQVIAGKTEGLYGWIAANYLLGGYDRQAESNSAMDEHRTFGFLDMGGASVQIAFAPNSTEAQKHAEDLTLVRMRSLDGSPMEHRVFTTTWLGFGANKARDRLVDSLQELYNHETRELPDPCMPKGLRTFLSGEPVLEGSTRPEERTLVGTGMFDECLRLTYPLLGKDEPCEDEPCLLNGQHVPLIDFDINRFVGVSEFWHSTHGVFGSKHKAYDLATYQQQVHDFCTRDWSEIESGFTKRKKSAAKKAKDAREACFKASWVLNVLYEGIGIPRIGLEETGGSHNTTKEIMDKAKGKGLTDLFQPMDTVEGNELSWTLGRILLYAAGQVQPNGSSLPVGFGSNVESGQPKDFELAGSSPIPLGNNIDDDDDSWSSNSHTQSSGIASKVIAVLLILVLLAYIFRKPERRRQATTLFKRSRRSGTSKGNRKRGFSLVNKLLGRRNFTYERVLEDGEAEAFELGSVGSDEHDFTVDVEEVMPGVGDTLSAAKSTAERGDDGRQASTLDRTGMAMRTGSCERLAPTMLLSYAGRRSRAGSPTRQKSPLTTVLDE